VRVTRQVCQHSLWSCEGFFGIYDPLDLAQWFEEVVEGILVNDGSIPTKVRNPPQDLAYI
jgi:hypothetical protein